jgi:beta-lactamase regulating signal transducer with metallopeptidase domain
MSMFNLVLFPQPAAIAALVWAAETAAVASLLALAAHLAARQPWITLGPAARHALWLVVLIKLVTPPLIHWPRSASIHTNAIPDEHLAQWSEGKDRPTDPTHVGTPGGPTAIALDPTRTPASITQASGKPEGAYSQEESHPSLAGAPLDRHIAASRQVDSIDQTGFKNRQEPRPPSRAHALWPRAAQWAVTLWLAGSILFGARQATRVFRSRRLVRNAVTAPEWLDELAEKIGWLLRVQPPEIRVTACSVTPRLWCLGRPVLLIPKEVLSTLKADRWRGILMHELAHLKRGDHWVSRIELAAGLVWWWNPLYWWTARRLETEAELACDAWVVSSLPRQRLEYADSLVQVCTLLSLARLPSPSLGVTGAGQFLERRLTMILNERVPCRLPVLGFLAAALLFLLALPAWLVAAPAPRASGPEARLGALPDPAAAQDPARDEDEDDDEDDDAEDADVDKDDDDPIDEEELEQEIKKALGPDFEKKMQAIGEKIGKEMEAKFGPGSDFEKKMEAMGKDFEQQFGDDFAKKMEAFGKEMEEKFGPDFEKKMEAFGREMEEKFGPEFQKKMEGFGKDFEKSFGPEFQESMKKLGDDLAKELGPGSDFEKAIKQAKAKARAKVKGGDTKAQSEDEASRIKEAVARVLEMSRAAEARARVREDREARVKARPESRARSARIRALESRIQQLAEELERLKSLEDEDDEGNE